MAEINVSSLLADIQDTVKAYDNVAGLVLQAEIKDGLAEELGMFLTFEEAMIPSLFGKFEIFDLPVEGLQQIYDECSLEFPNLAVNLIISSVQVTQ